MTATETASPPAPRSRYAAALRNRDLRLLLTAFLVDETCSWSYGVVLAAYVFERTGSPGWVAAMFATRWITGMIVGIPAGVLADRYERTSLVRGGAIAGAVVMVGITVVVATDASLWLLIVLGVLAGAATSANRPAIGAMVPEIVEEQDLTAANALFAGLENLVVVIGPAVGGLILLVGSPAVAVGVNAVSFLVSAALFTLVRTRSKGSAARGEGMVKQLADGWRALASDRVVFILVIYLVLDSAVFGAATVIYGPLSAHLGSGADGYSYLIAANAVGGVVGAALADRLAALPRLGAVIIGALAVESLPLAVTALTDVPVVAAALQVVFGVGMVIVDVVAITAMQRVVSGELLGRVNAIMFSMILGANVVASFGASALLTATNLSTTLVIIGVAFPAVALLGLPALAKQERTTAAATAALEPRISLISTLDLFTGASRPMLEGLAKAATEEQLPAGTTLIEQDAPADALYLLTDGTLDVTVRAASGRLNTRPDVVAPGYVGEVGLLRQIPRTATVRAKTPVTVLRISGPDFLATLSNGSASRSLMSLAGERFARYTPPSPAPIAAPPDAPRPRPRPAPPTPPRA